METESVNGRAVGSMTVAFANSSFDGGDATAAPGNATARETAARSAAERISVRFMRTPPFRPRCSSRLLKNHSRLAGPARGVVYREAKDLRVRVIGDVRGRDDQVVDAVSERAGVE